MNWLDKKTYARALTLISVLGTGAYAWGQEAETTPAPKDDAAKIAAANEEEATENSSKIPFDRLREAHAGWRGTMGIHRLETARPLNTLDLVFSAGISFMQTEDFLIANDLTTQQKIDLFLAFSPVRYLDISASFSVNTVENSLSLPSSTLQIIGDPSLMLKFSYPLSKWIGFGAALKWFLPTSRLGTGLLVEASSFDAELLLSTFPLEWLEASLNVGYGYRGAENLFAAPPAGQPLVTSAQRYAGSIYGTDLINVGLGASVNYPIKDLLAIGGLLEVTGQIPLNAPGEPVPLWASVGLRVSPGMSRNIELSAGADIRLRGRPQQTNDRVLPGLPPWQIFARLTAHLSPREMPQSIESRPVQNTLSCDEKNACTEGLSCVEKMCVRLVENEVVKLVAPQTMALGGLVVDASNKAPISTAVIEMKGLGKTIYRFAVDPETGRFDTQAFETGDGLVQLKVNAPGYREGEMTVARQPDESTKSLSISLKPLSKSAKGELKGSIKAASSGKGLRATVFIPSKNKRLKSNAAGEFSLSLPVGVYEILISAKRFTTQRKTVRIRRDGDVVILNIDMKR